jgi:D-alanyl-D-alanine carboxypeptidase
MKRIIFLFSFLLCTGAVTFAGVQRCFNDRTGFIPSSVWATADQTFNPETALTLQHVLDSLQIAQNIPGISASIFYPGEGIWKGVSGESHPGHSVTTEMIFGIGSNTKLFTSVLILKLVENGLLELDDSIYQWIPFHPNIDSTITIKQLLNHTSGLRSYNAIQGYNDSIYKDPDRIFVPYEFLEWIGPRVYSPGTGWNYSNSNYLLAGIIAEKITGRDIASLLRDSIFTPLGLTHTTFSVEPLAGVLAHPWDAGVDNYATPRTSIHSAAWAAGGMYSNAADMSGWYYNLFNGGILSAASIDRMTEFSGPQQYGLGIMEYTITGQKFRGHSGSILGGYTSIFLYDPEKKFSVSVLVNTRNGPVLLIATELIKTLQSSLPSGIGKGLAAYWSFDNDNGVGDNG